MNSIHVQFPLASLFGWLIGFLSQGLSYHPGKYRALHLLTSPQVVQRLLKWMAPYHAQYTAFFALPQADECQLLCHWFWIMNSQFCCLSHVLIVAQTKYNSKQFSKQMLYPQHYQNMNINLHMPILNGMQAFQ